MTDNDNIRMWAVEMALRFQDPDSTPKEIVDTARTLHDFVKEG